MYFWAQGELTCSPLVTANNPAIFQILMYVNYSTDLRLLLRHPVPYSCIDSVLSDRRLIDPVSVRKRAFIINWVIKIKDGELKMIYLRHILPINKYLQIILKIRYILLLIKSNALAKYQFHKYTIYLRTE